MAHTYTNGLENSNAEREVVNIFKRDVNFKIILASSLTSHRHGYNRDMCCFSAFKIKNFENKKTS
jgi:hypothetical protein